MALDAEGIEHALLDALSAAADAEVSLGYPPILRVLRISNEKS